MEKRPSASARIFAVVALAVGFIVAVAIVGGAFEGGDSNGDRGGGGTATRQAEQPQRKVPATYVVESGDTLIGIAQQTGVPVAQIEALNPEVDPQILVAGEELKLR